MLPEKPNCNLSAGIATGETTACAEEKDPVSTICSRPRPSRYGPKVTGSRRALRIATPPLSGRIRVRCEDARGSAHESWVARLAGLSVRVSDRVLILKVPNQLDPIAVGVVDGFSRRPQAPRQIAQMLELKPDETLQVNAENGQPLLHIARHGQGQVIRLLQVDTQSSFLASSASRRVRLSCGPAKGPCASTHPTTSRWLGRPYT